MEPKAARDDRRMTTDSLPLRLLLATLAGTVSWGKPEANR
jgi:hypothetical protein